MVTAMECIIEWRKIELLERENYAIMRTTSKVKCSLEQCNAQRLSSNYRHRFLLVQTTVRCLLMAVLEHVVQQVNNAVAVAIFIIIPAATAQQVSLLLLQYHKTMLKLAVTLPFSQPFPGSPRLADNPPNYRGTLFGISAVAVFVSAVVPSDSRPGRK